MKAHTDYCLKVRNALLGTSLEKELTCECPDAPRHVELCDEAIEELEHAIGHLRLARTYVMPSGIRTSLGFASVAIGNAQLVIAGAVEGCKC